ncbi:hypothetical protein PHET_04219 [Paragonimus heterotremus]|uniref:Uncharacterized protein n=1 Tax=Paragonimus heterotremus TaxID=100268 RepID=A0A8J4WJG0_9TREM|nr:hypothetical protein PHET_04219 [Paragonimus heterotremus]
MRTRVVSTFLYTHFYGTFSILSTSFSLNDSFIFFALVCSYLIFYLNCTVYTRSCVAVQIGTVNEFSLNCANTRVWQSEGPVDTDTFNQVWVSLEPSQTDYKVR